MMSKTAVLVLGADKFTVGAMNLGQLELAMPVIQSLSRADDGLSQVSKLLDVVQIGLMEGYPDVDVRKCTATLDELKTALSGLMQISGFETKAVAPGEAPARVKSTSRRSAKS